MKLQIELSEIEGIARNKILFDVGNIIDKDIMNTFMENTDKCIKSKFGSMYITEDYITLNLDPKCFIDFAELLNKTLKSTSASIVYYTSLRKIINTAIKIFNEKWEVFENENTNKIIK